MSTNMRPGFAAWNAKIDVIILAAVATCAAGVALWRVPFSAPLPYYLDALESFKAGNPVELGFLPVGYLFYLLLPFQLAGEFGIYFAHLLAYFLTVLLAYVILRLLNVRRFLLLGACLIIALHPYLWINLKRVIDNNIAVPLLLMFVLVLVWIRAGHFNRWSLLLWAIVCGIMIQVRPNTASLMPLALGILWVEERKRNFSRRHAFGLLGLFLVLVFGSMMLISLPMTGKIFYIPSNGVYNIFVGANEFTREALLTQYNVEPSLGPALQYHGLSLEQPDIYERVGRLGIEFIYNHPLEYVELIGIKAFTLFRPDYRQVFTSNTVSVPVLLFLVQTVLSLPIVIWAVMRAVTWRIVSIWDGVMAIPVGFLYLIPFVLTTADPRYRLSLDVLLLIDVAFCMNQWLAARARPVALSQTI